jgi:hypothetical protein
MTGKASGEPVDVTANDRSNSLIILSSEANYKAIERIVTTLDTEDAQEKSMHLFPLKNADAEDFNKILDSQLIKLGYESYKVSKVNLKDPSLKVITTNN